MSLFTTTVTSSPTPQVINPNFRKPMTRCTVIPIGNVFTSVDVTVQGQTIPLGSSGVGLLFEQPGPVTITGTGDQVFIICEQSDNFQLSGQLVTVLTGGGGGGGGGTTYSADGVTLQLSGTTFSIKNSGVGTAQLANNAVDASKLNTSVAGAGLTGGGGTALAVNVDNSTIEIGLGILGLKAGGVSSGFLAADAVIEGKAGNNSITGPAVGAGGMAQMQFGQCSQLDVTGQPAPGDGIQLTVEVPGYSSTQVFVAGTDFAIGGSAADTLNNLVAAINAAFLGNCTALANLTGDYAILQPAAAQYPIAGQNVRAVVNASTLTNYAYSLTAADAYGYNQTRTKMVWSGLPLTVAAGDVTRGFIAVIGDSLAQFPAAVTAPWLLCKTSAGVMKACGAAVAYDININAWTITNTGTNDFAAGDEILLLTFTPQTA